MNHTSLTTTTLATQGWATQPSRDAYQQMFGQEPRDWSLLRLVLAAGLTVVALFLTVAVYP